MVDYGNEKYRLDVLSDIHKNFKAIGLAIKKAREEQNISIVFLSEALKINEDYLMAIEKGDKSSLPELVYVKAMLRKIFERLNIETVDTKIKHSNKEKGNILKNESKKVTGILSERDLSRFIYAEKFNLTLPVSELMSKSLVTCDLNTSVTELMDEMTEKKIRHILIMEDKKLIGIVSIGDVVKHLINKIEEENKNLKDYINSY